MVDRVLLPKMEVNGVWLGRNEECQVRTPVIDEIVTLVGGTATIFQKMDDAGDMLRVATSVETLDGKRAIGTYIPATDTHGEPNPVIAAVMQGRAFRGRAFVVNAWYLTAYEPIRDVAGEIIGMLYVGVKRSDIETLITRIRNTRVGSDGYVFVLRGTGKDKGSYIISKDGEQDGKSVLDASFAEGHYPIKEMLEEAIAADGELVFKDYLWKNPGEPEPRRKVAALHYYAPWDWVIGTSIYQSDMMKATDKVAATISSLLFWVVGGGLVVAILASILASLMGARFTKPLTRIIHVADSIASGDISGASAAISKLATDGEKGAMIGRMDGDEAQQLLYSINAMTENLNSLIGKVQLSGIHITSSSTQIAASAKQLEGTIADQASSTNEVLSTTTEISGVARELVTVMKRVSSSAATTAEMAGHGRSDLERMGEAMQRLASATHSISTRLGVIDEKTESVKTVVSTINRVADQTNLLSLNASIEAEKAGEAGRGFSVVAREIQRMADQTAVAMMDIEQIVSEMRGAVQSGVKEMDTFSSEMTSFSSEVKRINGDQEAVIARVQELTPAFAEVNEGMHAQAQAAEQIRDAIVRLSEGAEQAATALNEFRQTATSLNESAYSLQDEISKFEVTT
jgi:methyl-accepting chemotaxis protein